MAKPPPSVTQAMPVRPNPYPLQFINRAYFKRALLLICTLHSLVPLSVCCCSTPTLHPVALMCPSNLLVQCHLHATLSSNVYFHVDVYIYISRKQRCLYVSLYLTPSVYIQLNTWYILDTPRSRQDKPITAQQRVYCTTWRTAMRCHTEYCSSSGNCACGSLSVH